MDDLSIDTLISDNRKRQYWLKPIGFPKDHPDWDKDEFRAWTESQIEIHFAKNPVKIHVFDVVIAYRIHCSKLIYVAERLPQEQWMEPEPRSTYAKRRWPHYIKAKNLSPEYGAVWNRYSFQPFPLKDEYNELHPEDAVRLGSIQRGNDKAAISRGFAMFLIRFIRNATLASNK